MNRLAGGCVLAVASLLAALGLVFVIAARTGPGLLMLIIGGGLVVFSATRLRMAAQATPQALRRRVSELAATSGGELTVAQVTGTLGTDAVSAAAALDGLVSEGVAQAEVRDGVKVYTFPGLREVKKIKRCPFCGNEYPLREPGRTCRSCGGNLEIVDSK